MDRLFLLRLALLGTLLGGCSATVVSEPEPIAMETPVTKATEKTTKLKPDNALERRVLYYPSKKIYGERPSDVKELTIETTDGLQLTAWYLPPPDSQPLIVHFHGNGGNITSYANMFKVVRDMGCGMLAVDYRGFGSSEGEPSEEGLYLDGLATYDKAQELAASSPLIIHGRSLGGGVASYVASKRDPEALIMESTFTSAKAVAEYSHGETGAALIDAFDNESRLYEVPVLLIHGTGDETIPSFMSEQLHQQIDDSELWLVQNAGHNNLRWKAGESEYAARLLDFIERAVKSD